MTPLMQYIPRKGAKARRLAQKAVSVPFRIKVQSNNVNTPNASRLCAFARASLFMVTILYMSGCATGRRYWVPRNQKPLTVKMETTGYCKCGKCCGWERNWKFQPVVAYGPNKGQPKAVGITATGTTADWGTIAADTRYYPFGTIMHVPGYGWGRVEDVGSAIKGHHIDLYFPSHRQAQKWGRVYKQVKVWKAR